MKSHITSGGTAPQEKKGSWLGRLFGGGSSSKKDDQDTDKTKAAELIELHILFGTQTGNAESVARDAASKAKSQGFQPKVMGFEDVSLEHFKKLDRVLIITSTYGDGEMPDNAQAFWEELSAADAPHLDKLSYAVLALGDTGHEEFCNAGRLMDAKLEALGARRLNTRGDCDFDFEEPAAKWLDATLPMIARDAKTSNASSSELSTTEETTTPASKADTTQWSRKTPFNAPVKENTLLSLQGSQKEVRLFTFDLSGSGLTYEPGDALSIVPRNNSELVEAVLDRLGVKHDAEVAGVDGPLGDALTTQLEISTPSKALIAALAERTSDEDFKNVVSSDNAEALGAFLRGRDTLDLLQLDENLVMSPEEIVSYLRPLQHRSYSISSSPKVHGDDVQLTVSVVRWEFDGRRHRGVCSTFMADTLNPGENAPVFMTPNRSFRLPEDDNAPVIMVGPGTGVSPFHSFLEERQARGAQGRNWLFFGDQRQEYDFLYKDEFTKMNSDGFLTQLDLAFSRDQTEKVYVQSRMRENARELFSWLEDGAHFYVCGEAAHMAPDVDTALTEIVAEQGLLSLEEAADYVANLKREKRYLRDVY